MKVAYEEFHMLSDEKADLSGYGFSRGVTDECLDAPLCCLFLMKNDQNLYLLITLDTVAISEEFTKEIKMALEKEGIYKENVNIMALHTHSGPGITCFPDDCKFDGSTIRNKQLALSLQKKIIKSVKKMKETMQEMQIWCGEININGCYGNRNDPKKQVCKKMYLTKFVTTEEENKTKIVVANMSCHSTILKADTMQFSSDLAGAVRRNLSKIYRCPCMMTIGAAADVSSRFYVKEHDYQAVLKTGEEIASQVRNIQFQKMVIHDISIETVPFDEIYDPRVDEELRLLIKRLKGTNLEFMIPTLEKRRRHGKFHIKTYATIMKTSIADIIFFPGELVTALGDKIRNSVEKKVIFCCYANDYWQYFVAKEEYGKYFETANSICPKGMADQFVEMMIQKLKG